MSLARRRKKRIALAITAVMLVVLDPLWGTDAWVAALAIKAGLFGTLAVAIAATPTTGAGR